MLPVRKELLSIIYMSFKPQAVEEDPVIPPKLL
jgi:hypothetical protein